MGFRLMSFATGAAKRGSERLKALEEDTKETDYDGSCVLQKMLVISIRHVSKA